MKKFIRNIKNAVWYDDVEVMVRDATSNSEQGVTSQQLQLLSRTAKDPNKYPTIFAMLWKRITHYKHHRHIEKALYVLIYLVRLKPPSADVQRRLIDDILQPSQFTDLRLLANLRERAAFPILNKIKTQAQDLLAWLMEKRSLDASKLNPIPAEGFDLPEPQQDDNSGNGDRFQNQGFQQPPQHNSLDIFDLLAESMQQDHHNNNNNNNPFGNGHNNNNSNSNHNFDGFGFDPFADITNSFGGNNNAPANPNNGAQTKICDFCEFENDFDAVICVNCGCEFGAFENLNWEDETPHSHNNGDGATPNNNNTDDYITCPKCGARNPQGSKFCCGCGCDLQGALHPNHGSHNGASQHGNNINARQREIRGWSCAWCSILNPTTKGNCQNCQKEKTASGHANAMKYQMACKRHANDDVTIWQCTCLNVNEGSAFYCRVCQLDYNNHVHSSSDNKGLANDGGHDVRNKQSFIDQRNQQQRKEMVQNDPSFSSARVSLPGLSTNQQLGQQTALQAQSQQRSPQLSNASLNSHDAKVKAHVQQSKQNQQQVHTPRPGVAQEITVQMVDEDFVEPIIVVQQSDNKPQQQKSHSFQSNQISTISRQPQLPLAPKQPENDDPFADLIGSFVQSEPLQLTQPTPSQQQQQQQPTSTPLNKTPVSPQSDVFDIFAMTSNTAATTDNNVRASSMTLDDFASSPQRPESARQSAPNDLFDLLQPNVLPSQQLLKQPAVQVVPTQPPTQQTQSQTSLSLSPQPAVKPLSIPSSPTTASSYTTGVFGANSGNNPPTINTTTQIPLDLLPMMISPTPVPQDTIGRPQTSRPSTAGVGGAQSFLSTIEKGQSYRKKVRMEILATEKSYIDQLCTLRDCFITPLRGAAVSMKISSQALISILTDVDPLIQLHQNFNASLIKSREDSIGTAALFSSTAQFMAVYQEYVANYPKTLATIEKLVGENKEFAKFHATVSADPRMASRPLSSFYIAPVQRLPRYVLLLKELKHAYEKTIKQAGDIFTNPSLAANPEKLDEDLISIQMNPEVLHAMENEIGQIDFATEVMNKAAITVNEYQKQVEGCIKLEQIHTKLGKKHQALQLREPQKTHRKLIREDMFKQDKNGKLRDMTSILCNDAIFWITPSGTDFKGGMNLLHLAFRTSSASTFYNDRWNLQFKEIPAAPGGEYYIDFRCHENCFDNHGGMSEREKAKNDVIDSSSYYATLSRDMFGQNRPQSANISAHQQEQQQQEASQREANAKIDPIVIQHLCIDKPHSITFFRLTFPSLESMNSYAKLLCELIDVVRASSTVGYQNSRQRRVSSALPPSTDPANLSSPMSNRPPSATFSGPHTIKTSSSTSLQSTSSTTTGPGSSTFAPFVPRDSTNFTLAPEPTVSIAGSPNSSVSALSGLNSMGSSQPPLQRPMSSLGGPEGATSPGSTRKSVVAQGTAPNPLAFTPSAAPTFVFKTAPKPEPKPESKLQDSFVPTATTQSSTTTNPATAVTQSQSDNNAPHSRPTSAMAPPPGFTMPAKQATPTTAPPTSMAPPGMALPPVPGAEPAKAPVALPGVGANPSAIGSRGLVMPAKRQSVVMTTTPAVNPFAKPTIG